jgi:hypothetical protein
MEPIEKTYKTHESRRKIALQNYYLKHDKYLQAAKDYYWSHREEKKEYYKQWKEKNYEKLLARRREIYALKHPKKEKIPKPEKSRKPQKSVAAPKTPKPKPEPKPKSQQIFYTNPEIPQPFKEASFIVSWD